MIGLVDADRVSANKSLADHLADFEQSLRAKDCTERHVSLVTGRARHSDITLTMNRYSHSYRDQEIDALRTLPDLSNPSRQRLRATGTDDAMAGDFHSADYLAQNERRGASDGGAGRLDHSDHGNADNARKSVQASDKRGSGTVERDENALRPAGLEPAAYGLGNHRSIHLSYGRRAASPSVYAMSPSRTNAHPFGMSNHKQKRPAGVRLPVGHFLTRMFGPVRTPARHAGGPGDCGRRPALSENAV